MSVSWNALARRVQRATVRIQPAVDGYAEGGLHPEALEDPEAPGGRALAAQPTAWGSGFFVAPGWVLTCAHVLRREEGGIGMGEGGPGVHEVGLVFDGRSAVGEVRHALHSPEDGVDIAIIRAYDAEPHVFLPLSEDTGDPGDQILFFGHSRETGPLRPISVVGTIGGTVAATRGDSANEQYLLDGMTVPRGVSGGPVYHRARAEVIGIVTHQADDRRGGLASSLMQLRGLFTEGAGDLYHLLWQAHDHAHYTHHFRPAQTDGPLRAMESWTTVRARATPEHGRPEGPLSHARRTELRGLLAAIAPPEHPRSVIAAVEAVRGDWVEPDTVPHLWRDGLDLLYDVRGRTTLEATLLYSVAVAEQAPLEDPEPRRRLLAWYTATAREDGLLDRLDGPREALRAWGAAVREERAAAGLVPLVRLEVYELYYRADAGHSRAVHYGWTLSGTDGDEFDTGFRGQDDSGVLREDLAGRLLRPLARAFDWSDRPGRPAALEVRLPIGLFDLPVDRWPVAGRDPLGAQRPVTVRWAERPGPPSSGRQSEDSPRRAHERRWKGIADGPLRLYALHGEDGALRSTITLSELREADPKAVPALFCPAEGPVPEEVLLRVVSAGHGIAVWNRDAAWRYGWREFERGLRGALASVPRPDALPAALHRLRAGANARDPRASWCEDLAVLYDPAPAAEAPPEEEYLCEPL
ncbi:VMAP-C domain-containing protein [Streptomyces varsoviensis]|nr:trypsin-like peptidase domain-containing protein [Streptomyces varsoviensis]